MVADIIVREAVLKDLPALKALAHSIWHEHYVPIIGLEQVEYMLGEWYGDAELKRQLSDEARTTKLVETPQGEMIGYIQYELQGEAMFVHKAYLASEHRGKGIGKHLFGQITHRPMMLRVNKDNADSIAFYKRYGFEIIAEEVSDIGQGYVRDDYVMQCL